MNGVIQLLEEADNISDECRDNGLIDRMADMLRVVDDAFNHMHFDCNNDDHRAGYLMMAEGLGYK